LRDVTEAFSGESISELEEYARALMLRENAISDLRSNYKDWLEILRTGN